MKLFKKRKQKENNTEGPSDKMAKGIVSFILKIQTAFARLMSKWTKNLPSSSMKTGLIIFCLTGFGLSIYFIVIAVLIKDGRSKVINIDRLAVPKYYNNDDDYSRPELLITKEQYEEMQAFRIYMDSLQHANKRAYDSIVILRPHLLDSVIMLEEIYQTEHEKEIKK